MKNIPIIILVVITAGCGLLLFWQEWRPLFMAHRQHVEGLMLPDQPTSSGLPRLVAAMKGYSRDYISRGQALPASLTLQDLVNGGYLSTNDVQALNGADVTFYLTASNRNPQAVLVRMRMPDGRQIVALTDGSIQQLPR